MKSEPDEFSIDDLARVGVEPWSGVRSFMARFQMRQMTVGDGVLFHHSSVDPPGVAGLARVIRTEVVDEKQFDPNSKYYEPRATRDKPIWDCVDVEFVAKFPHFVSMDRLRAAGPLAEMWVLKRGMRLSVQPVTDTEYAHVIELGNTEPPPEPPKPPRAPKPRTAPKPAHPAKTARRAVSKKAKTSRRKSTAKRRRR
jgi:predicted RNA-binding protein with PUA-like domain